MQKLVFTLALVMLVSGCGPGKSRPHRPQLLVGSTHAAPTLAQETLVPSDSTAPVQSFEAGKNSNNDSVLADPESVQAADVKEETVAALAPVQNISAKVPLASEPVVQAAPVQQAAPAASTPSTGTTPITAKATASGTTPVAPVNQTPSAESAAPAEVAKVAAPKTEDKPAPADSVVVATPAPVVPAETQPAETTSSTGVVGQCPGVSSQEKDWFPGLASPLATQPLFTGAVDPIGQNGEDVKKDPNLGFRYVDAGQDGLLNLAMDKVKSLPQAQQDADRKFAPRFSDVEVSTDLRKSGKVKVHFLYEYTNGKFAPITLEGRAKDAKKKTSADIELKQVAGKLSPAFIGHLACMDADGGCQSTAITFQRLGKDGKPGRAARVVHRFGEARLTLADLDLRASSTIQNKAHKAFAEYLSNTVNNSCLRFMAEATAAGRAIDPCEAQRLQVDCGNGQKRSPAAKAVIVRSWSVAFGRSGFEVAAEERGTTADKAARAKLVIAGPLGLSPQRPMWPHNLLVKGGFGIAEAHLIATDGGGNINLQLVFAGQPSSHTRLNVTSLFENVRSAK